MKRLLDELRSELYGTLPPPCEGIRGIKEKRSRQKTLFASFLSSTDIIQACVDFWDGAKLTNKLVGRMKFKEKCYLRMVYPTCSPKFRHCCTRNFE